jgi:cytochrome c peroxidase
MFFCVLALENYHARVTLLPVAMPRCVRSSALSLLLVAALLPVSGCKGRNVPPAPKGKQTAAAVGSAKVPPALRRVEVPEREIRDYEFSSFRPLPKAFTKDGELPPKAQIDLGRMLFFDARFSKNHDVPCNECHTLDEYGVDGLNVSIGHGGQAGKRNAPTVYNAAANSMQFWDGRSASVEEQAKVPVLDKLEMAMPDEQSVVAVIRSIPGYAALFQAAFPEDADPIRFDNWAKAIGAFERGLVTPAPWDKFRAGDENAVSAEAKQGFVTFNVVGCPTCHSGMMVGGSLFETLGRHKPWPNQTDKGREEVTKDPKQRMIFKTASLRNVEKTGPYFHDASENNLEKAVHKMGEYQLGVDLDPQQVASIVAFLKSLTGEIDQDYIKEPKLPESSASTPKADPS